MTNYQFYHLEGCFEQLVAFGQNLVLKYRTLMLPEIRMLKQLKTRALDEKGKISVLNVVV